MNPVDSEYQELPEHVRRIIERDGEIEFTPPSFERWLGRLQMIRTISAMGAFLLVWLVTYGSGSSWENATVRGIIAAVVFYFFAWAAGLFIFGELYDVEVKTARTELELKERERARRIEAYYRQRLRAQEAVGRGEEPASIEGAAQLLDDPLVAAIPGYVPSNVDAPPLAA
jgi:hypothetical protein